MPHPSHLPTDEKLSKRDAEIAFDFSSAAMNQLILRAAGEGIYGVNADGKTTFVNPAAERMLGWSAEELVGHDMHSIVHHTRPDGGHYPAHDCPIYAAFRDGAVHQIDSEVFWRKDGTPFCV
jgi:formate hydrogenlyase transcriptional activator